jgi:hypothetical protein
MRFFFQFGAIATDVRSARALLAAKHGEDLCLLGAIAAARAGTSRMTPCGPDGGVGGIAPRPWRRRGPAGAAWAPLVDLASHACRDATTVSAERWRPPMWRAFRDADTLMRQVAVRPPSTMRPAPFM